MLAGFLRNELTGRAQVIVTDAEAPRRCADVALGAQVTVSVGGSLSTAFHSPVEITGTVVTLTDGRFQSLYPPAPSSSARPGSCAWVSTCTS